MSKVILDVSMSLDGWEGWADFAHVGALMAFGLAMWRLAIHAMTRKLID